jgi:preprotein translocase SecE subunit
MAETTRTRAVDFLGEVREQIGKVTWPDWPQLKNSTFVIGVFGIAVAALIFVIDLGVRGMLGVVSSLFGS